MNTMKQHLRALDAETDMKNANKTKQTANRKADNDKGINEVLMNDTNILPVQPVALDIYPY